MQLRQYKYVFLKIPLIGKGIISIYKFLGKLIKIKSSEEYWERRYATGGNSGSGSYKHLAQFKSNILNEFVSSNSIESVIEFGCGDGNQLTLAKYPSYIGLDVSRTAVNICAKKFREDHTKSFFIYDSQAFYDHKGLFLSDLALSLDVIFHILEDKIYEYYMKHLFASAKRYVIIYSSNSEEERFFHVKNRKFTEWVDKNIFNFQLVKVIENEFKYDPQNPTETTFADFYVYEKKNSTIDS